LKGIIFDIRTKFKENLSRRFFLIAKTSTPFFDFGFWGLTPKPEVEIFETMGGFVAPGETYRTVKKSRRSVQKWPRYRGSKKFV